MGNVSTNVYAKFHFAPQRIKKASVHPNDVTLTQTYTVKAVSKVSKFSDIACSIISRLVLGIFVPKNSIVTKFCRLVLGGLVIMTHRVFGKVNFAPTLLQRGAW